MSLTKMSLTKRFLGFFLAFIIGIMLMVSIWRSGKD